MRICNTRYRLVFVLGILRGLRGKFPDDVSGAAVGSETLSGSLPRTPCKIPKIKNHYLFHGENLKSRYRLFQTFFFPRTI